MHALTLACIDIGVHALIAGDVFEIGKRFPHEIEVASSDDGVNPAEYVYVASVDSKDAGVAPGIGALVRYKAT